jgi:hypothetical protein
MIEQHQIPQEISSYEFRLVGNMTLKQFLKMAAGVLVAALFYTSHLNTFFKFVGILISVATGFAFAFLPVNERPLESWILNFFKRIYSPTIYLWKKSKAKANIAALAQQAKRAKFFEKVEVVDKQKTMEEFVESLPEEPVIQQPAVKKTTTIYQTQPAAVPPPIETKEPVIESQPEPISPPPEEGPSWEQIMSLWEQEKKKGTTREAEFIKTHLPATPTTPNIISGLVADENGNEIEGAIVEIQDLEGNPVRAMRTNGLGQFQTATPLAKGEYLIVVEKEPYQFDIMKLAAKGEIIAPVEIKAKRTY